MIVPCPYCATRYTIDAARLTGPSPMLKCSRCRRVFPAPPQKKQAPGSSKGAAPEEKNLTLPFDEPGWKDEAPAPSRDLTISESEEEYMLGADEPAHDLVVPPDPAAEPEPPPRQAEQPAPRPTPTPYASSHASPIEDAEHDEADMDAGEVGEADDIPSRRAPARRRAARGTGARGATSRDNERGKVSALMIFLAAVLACYGMLARALFASPQLCDRLLSRVPLVGALGDERLLTRKVALSDVTGSYQRIKDGKQVFIISGKALNTAPVALHDVQIAGRLFNNEGHVIEEKVIFCGNVISAKMLKDLTSPGVSILQNLRPAKGFAIEPGESSTFVIVFMDPPRQAAEFATQVTAAQHHA